MPIQALVRGVLTRKILMYWRWSTVLVQARVRGVLSVRVPLLPCRRYTIVTTPPHLPLLQRYHRMKYSAARTMQALVRGFITKLAYKRFRHDAKNSVRVLGAWWLARIAAYKARVFVRLLKQMIACAELIQAAVRTWLEDRHNAAALCIQRNVRAYYVRRVIAEYYIQLMELDTMRMEEEVQLMVEAEAEAGDDMEDYLVSNWKGRLDVDERAKALRREARDRKRVFEEAAAAAGADGVSPTLVRVPRRCVLSASLAVPPRVSVCACAHSAMFVFSRWTTQCLILCATSSPCTTWTATGRWTRRSCS